MSAEIQNGWSKTLPGESGLYWWWSEDEDSLPIVVDIAYSGTDGTYFAMQGQHGWNTFQQCEEMGGYWMRLPEPKLPTQTEAAQQSEASSQRQLTEQP